VPPEFSGYRIISQIGVGARSTISQVVRVTGGPFLALKRVVRRSADDDRFLQQAENEFAVASTLQHAALRKCIEIRRKKKWFQTQELLILMEYVDGPTLEDGRSDDIGLVIDITRKVAGGLDALHEQGFVHADIKPSNIILLDSGEVKIIDFGQSCPIGHKKDRIQGTPDYIAPEQIQKLPLDRRTDIYNLGATLYWLLTNRTYPTEMSAVGHSGHEIKIRQSPKEINPKIPASLSQLALDCCHTAPDKRPADMRQVISRLDVADKMWKKQSASSDAVPTQDDHDTH
jgi:eukaryotic-like serine/threonine-protein kinase